MKEQKYHIYLTNQERSEIIESLIDFKNLRMQQGKYTDAVDGDGVLECQLFHVCLLSINRGRRPDATAR